MMAIVYAILIIAVTSLSAIAANVQLSDSPSDVPLELPRLWRGPVPQGTNRVDVEFVSFVRTNANGVEEVVLECVEDRSWMVHYPAYVEKTSNGLFCTKHHTVLTECVIPVVYGLPGPLKAGDNGWAGETNEYPNAYTSEHAGCVMSANSPRARKALFCEQCRQRKRELKAQQTLPPVSGTRGTPAACAPGAPGIPER